MKKTLLLRVASACFYLPFIGLLSFSASAQCWNAGTGVDGNFHATVDTTIIGGSYNFTSFTIDQGVTVSVTGSNPLMIKCTEEVTINGFLSANGGNGTNGLTFSNAGSGGIGVAGGGNGGNGAFSADEGPLDGLSGSNVGAGSGGSTWSGGGGAGYSSVGGSASTTTGVGGAIYGDAEIVDFLAGSGGAGGSGGYNCGSGGGGAGGGYISINALAIYISESGAVTSNGGNGGSDGAGNCGGGGGGSGGSIHLAAITIVNNGSITALGGSGGSSELAYFPYYGTGGNGSEGRIRIDYNGTIEGEGVIEPISGFTTSIIEIETEEVTAACYGSTNGEVLLAVAGGVGPYTYLWEESNETTNPAVQLAAGVNTCIVTDATSCTKTIIVNVPSHDQINTEVTNEISILTAVSTTGTFQWIDCATNAAIDGETAATFEPTENGTYAVVVTVGNCSDTSACQVVNSLNIANTSMDLFSIAPNPTTGSFSVAFDKNAVVEELYVTDLSGRIIFEQSNTSANPLVIDLSAERAGVYLLNVSSSNSVKTIKITKH